MRFDLPTWTRHLRSVAGTRPGPSEPLSAGDLEGPVRAACLGAPATPPGPDAPASIRGEIALWRARSEPDVDVDAVLAASRAAQVEAAARETGPSGSGGSRGAGGSLLARDAYRAIEVWTDADLAACHALWWLAWTGGRTDWAEHLDAVRRWHLEHTQPDNATNRPWAIHVFLLAGSAEDEHYAQTLLHNALAMEAEPTPLGRVLLHDAADALEAAAD